MFINCRHCNALVATDPATDLPPERCPRCAGVLRRQAPAADAAQAAALEGRASADGGTSNTTLPAAADLLRPHIVAGIARGENTGSAGSAPPAPGQAPPPGPPPLLRAPLSPGLPGPAAGPGASGGRGPEPGAPAPPASGDGVAPTHPDTRAATGADAAIDGLDQPDQDPVPPAPPPSAATGLQPHATAAGAGAAPAPAFAGGARGAAPSRAARAWIRPAVIAALLLLLGLQILLADRDRLAADARWRPLVGAVCNVLGCSVPPWREPRAFVLLARDVRPHPRHPRALRASASFRNDARWPQAWPQVVLTLSDVDGRAIAARAFTREDYLGATPATPLVAPGQTVDIVLDIGEPSAEAVSYAWDLR